MSERVKTILIGLASIALAVFFFLTASDFDLVLFQIIPIDGNITFPIIGALLAIVGVALVVAGIMNKTDTKKEETKTENTDNK